MPAPSSAPAEAAAAAADADAARSADRPPEPSGLVFDVSRGCFEDGPGLRTVVFLKGCPWRCPWCHNPEGQSFGPQIAFAAERCLGCGRCAEACGRPWSPFIRDDWRPGCTGCGRCADVCPSAARRLVGRRLGVAEVVAAAAADEPFYRESGGGVTLSGGEPLAQPALALACAAALRARGLHVAVETAGCWPAALAAEVARSFDLVLFDLKHVDDERSRPFLGAPLGPALGNLAALLASSVEIEVRLTVVPGFNDGEADLRTLARHLAAGPRLPAVRLQPFHRLAAAKARLGGRPYAFARIPPLSEERLEAAERLLRQEGVAATCA